MKRRKVEKKKKKGEGVYIGARPAPSLLQPLSSLSLYHPPHAHLSLCSQNPLTALSLSTSDKKPSPNSFSLYNNQKS